MKYIERIANLAIIVAVVFFLGAMVRGNLLQQRPTPAPRRADVQVGSTISLPGVHFPAQRDSLLLGISTTCHYCKDSLPFYRQLTARLQGRVSVIAVLPQSQPEAEAFMRDAGLTGVQVVSEKLSNIGVYGTPTLLLVDDKGKVKSAWVGELDSGREQSLISAILPNDTNAVPRG